MFTICLGCAYRDEQMSSLDDHFPFFRGRAKGRKKLDIEHQPDIVYNYCTLINPDRYPKVADIYTQELLAL